MRSILKILGFGVMFIGNMSSSLGQSYDPELARRLEGKKKLRDIMQTVKEYYGVDQLVSGRGDPTIGLESTVPFTVYRELKRWTRWEYENSTILDGNGEPIDYEPHLNREMNKFFMSSDPTLQSSSGIWNLVGPKTVSYGNGLMIGNGRTDRIALHPNNGNIFYVATPNAGLWRTLDGGLNYTCVTEQLPSPAVSGVVVDWSNPNVLYILTGNGDNTNNDLVTRGGFRRNSIGVWKSTDGGYSWNNTGVLTNEPYRGLKLVQHPSIAGVLLAATTEGLYRTNNGGTSWSQIMPGTIWDVAFQPLGAGNTNRAYAVVRDNNTAVTGFRVSFDGGTNFQNATVFDFGIDSISRASIGVTPANTSRVYLLCGPGRPGSNNFYGFYRSTNGGLTFTRRSTTPNVFGKQKDDEESLDQSDYDNCIAVSTSNADSLWVGGLIVFGSGNGGDNFNPLTDYFDGLLIDKDNYVHPDVHGLAYNPINRRLLAATDGGIFISTDHGEKWLRRFNNLPVTQAYHMDVYDPDPQQLLAGYQDNGIQKRFTNTTDFKQLKTGDGFAIQFKSDESDDFYGVVNEKVYRMSSNAALLFKKLEFASFFPALAIHPTDNSRFYAGKDRFFNYEVKAGIDEWTIRNIPASWAIAPSQSNTSRIYAAGDVAFGPTTGGRVWRSDNGGDSWDTISTNPGFPSLNILGKVTSIFVFPTNSSRVWVTLGNTATGPKILYSINAGVSWTDLTSNLPNNLPVNTLVADANGNMYCGNDFGVFYRAAGWNNWKPFLNGLPRVPVTKLEIATSLNRIYAATFGRGVWASDLYSPCDNLVSVSGNLDGVWLHEAATGLTTTATTHKGGISNIIYRSGNYIDFKTGFEMANGAEMRAIRGPCNSPLPLMVLEQDGSGDLNSFQLAHTPMANGKKFPYAVIKNWRWVNTTTLEANIKVAATDSLRAYITNELGERLMEVLQPQVQFANSEFKITANISSTMRKQKLHLLLFHHNTLVHWQELN